jgi:hypothetical protein
MVENYLSIYQFALDPDGSQYKGPPNAVHNVARVFTPDDTGVVTPNSDTPYSFLVMDLRAEPLVVTLTAIEADRYYSLQLVDLYTHNVDYIGTRIDGNDGGDFLIAGPGWDGQAPPGVRRVVRIPTEIMYSQFRTQLYDAADLARVKEIQAGYAAQPLSGYAGTEAPPPALPIDWPPISRETAHLGFWSYANFLLQFAPPLEWEADIRSRFARIGVAPAAAWPPEDLRPDVLSAVTETGDAALAEIGVNVMKATSSAGLFGTPEQMKGKYLERAVGAMGGLYGLKEEEALYATYLTDEEGQRFDSSKNNYVMRFRRDTLPPAQAFWSITMYDGDTRFMVANPINRYLINSAMLPRLKENEAGEIVIYMQHDSPGPDLESNWLPAPDGVMGVVIRLYLPEPAALDGSWQAPPIEGIVRP